MDLRLSLAILVGKTISILNKHTGTGATAAPGLYALKIDPNLVKKLSKKIQFGAIIISGTNGKTTTARLTANSLSSKFKIIHNRAGSNLLRGIASTLISSSSLSGTINANLAIWEVDEATLGEAIENTNPRIITLLNLFRDQLDRYGEVDTTRIKWQKILSTETRNITLILNTDDPGISIIAKGFKGKIIFFGVQDKKLDLPKIDHVADIRHCLNCGSSLTYSALLSAHLGHYKCSRCDFKRPTTNTSASNIKFHEDFSTSIKLTIHHSPLTIHYSLPGLYNVYNILAATSIADELKIDHTKIKGGIENFSAAFGRFQSVSISNKSVLIFLIKNPAGANEVLRSLSLKNNLNILAILNDNFADGKDVSWIWDTNWEILKDITKSISTSGIRTWDLATRLKYAGFSLSKNNIYKEISYSLEACLNNMNIKDTLIVLPTYTALLEIQKTLAKLGGSTKWHDQ